MKKLLLAAVTAALMGSASTSFAATDVVYTRDLNYGYASCNPLKHTYWHKATRTVYTNAQIVCQLNLAYITYTRKSRFV